MQNFAYLNPLILEAAAALHDFRVFLDRWVWIEDKERKCPIKLTLWPSQVAIVPTLVDTLLLILLKTRQVGLTWLAAAYVLWQAIRSPLFLAIIISASEDHAIEFLNRVYFILDRLPKHIKPGRIQSRTKTEVTFLNPATSTFSTIKSMPTIEMGAESKTPNILIIDEAHSIREARGIYNSSYPGIEQAKGQVIIIANSVKSGPGWPFVRDMYMDSMAGINQFKRIFLPWMAHPGRPPDFRANMILAGMAKEDVIWHYPENEGEAISAIASSYFGDALARHTKAQHGMIGIFARDERSKEVNFYPEKNGIVELWRFPYFLAKGWDGISWERRYCMGSDVSEGLGQSYSIAYVMDRVVDEFVCKVRSNRIDAHQWADQLNLASDYYERALLMVERTGAGQTTVKRLEEVKANQAVRIAPAKVGGGVTKELGWHESVENKKFLCSEFRTWLKAMKGTVWDAELLGQCQTWILDEIGRPGPEVGKLGDCVMAGGCTIQAHQYLGEPVRIPLEATGWLKEWQEKGKGSAWAS